MRDNIGVINQMHTCITVIISILHLIWHARAVEPASWWPTKKELLSVINGSWLQQEGYHSDEFLLRWHALCQANPWAYLQWILSGTGPCCSCPEGKQDDLSDTYATALQLPNQASPLIPSWYAGKVNTSHDHKQQAIMQPYSMHSCIDILTFPHWISNATMQPVIVQAADFISVPIKTVSNESEKYIIRNSKVK